MRILLEATELPPLPDIIRLELLAGITPIDRQKQISRNLDKFPPLKQSVTDFNLAAEYFSICVMKGVTPDLVDVLLCAIAVRRRMKIFTKDRDFLGYEKHLPIKLYLRDLTFPQT